MLACALALSIATNAAPVDPALARSGHVVLRESEFLAWARSASPVMRLMLRDPAERARLVERRLRVALLWDDALTVFRANPAAGRDAGLKIVELLQARVRSDTSGEVAAMGADALAEAGRQRVAYVKDLEERICVAVLGVDMEPGLERSRRREELAHAARVFPGGAAEGERFGKANGLRLDVIGLASREALATATTPALAEEAFRGLPSQPRMTGVHEDASGLRIGVVWPRWDVRDGSPPRTAGEPPATEPFLRSLAARMAERRAGNALVADMVKRAGLKVDARAAAGLTLFVPSWIGACALERPDGPSELPWRPEGPWEPGAGPVVATWKGGSLRAGDLAAALGGSGGLLRAPVILGPSLVERAVVKAAIPQLALAEGLSSGVDRDPSLLDKLVQAAWAPVERATGERSASRMERLMGAEVRLEREAIDRMALPSIAPSAGGRR